jgi:hypothetical protein
MAIFLALVTAAVAQSPDISTSADGDLMVARRQEINVGALQSAVESLTLEVSQLKAAATGDSSPLMIGINAVAADLTARTTQMIQANAQVSAQVASMDAVVSTQLGQMSTSVAAALQAAATDSASRATAMDTRITAALSTVDASASTITRTLTASVSTSLAASTSSIRAINASVATQLGSKMSDTLHMWSGGCNNQGHSGWQEYCLNHVEINTAAPYFRKETNTRFRSSRAMYFTFEAYMLKRSHHWCYNLIYINGNHRRHSHGWTWDPWTSSHWVEDTVMLTYTIGVNQQFYSRQYVNSWTNWNSGRHHSRVTVIYRGKIL